MCVITPSDGYRLTRYQLRVYTCPAGRKGWNVFVDLCTKILNYLIVPPLSRPTIQPRSYSGVDRWDIIFLNRNSVSINNWGRLCKELNLRMILSDYKNNDNEEIGKDEMNQIRNNMKKSMGRLAIMCCNKKTNESVRIIRVI